MKHVTAIITYVIVTYILNVQLDDIGNKNIEPIFSFKINSLLPNPIYPFIFSKQVSLII